jgi:hypothetical protein
LLNKSDERKGKKVRKLAYISKCEFGGKLKKCFVFFLKKKHPKLNTLYC